jgi:HTH-type transcriptional regulator/antitoxin HigA
MIKKALNEIRALTKAKPEVFVPKLKSLCSVSGVALVLVPEMKEVPWSGASKWLTPEKPMILLSLRGKGEDKFWFSFFHEAGHIMNDSKKAVLINDESSDTPEEQEANEFAAELLIPKLRYDERIRKARSRVDITAIARELDISPGIVAGRYQYLTGRWSHFKEMIQGFIWAP